MLPKQATLGRFFSLPAGTKPPVQPQAKIKTPKKEGGGDGSTGVVGDDKQLKEALTAPAVKDEEGDAVMAGTPEAEEKELAPKKERGGKGVAAKEKRSNTSRKRARKTAEPVAQGSESVSEKEDEEPQTKRGKHLLISKSPAKGKKATKEPDGAREEELEVKSGAEGEDHEPVTKLSKRSATTKPPKKAALSKKSVRKPRARAKEAADESGLTPKEEDKEPVATSKKTELTPEKEDEEPVAASKKTELASDEEDEEPVARRGRKPIAGKKKAESPQKKAESPKKKVKSVKVEESDEEPVATSKKTKKKAESPQKKAESPKKKVKSVKVEESDEEPVTTSKKTELASDEEDKEPVARRGRKPTTGQKTKKKAESPQKPESPKKKVKSAKVEESDEGSKSDAVEEAEVGSDDDMKSALAEKARKVVAKQLLDKTQSHPYPDWEAGSSTPYGALVKIFTLVEGTTKRLEKLSHASLFLRQVLRLTPDDLLMVVHLMINKLAADYEGVELGIGESLLMKAIGESCGRSMDNVREEQNRTGDLGMVAMKSRNNQGTLFKPKPLTVKSVHQGLLEIATTKGEGGQGRKVAHIKKLLAAAKGDEAKYLVRGLEGKLRTGLAEKTVIVALSQAGIVNEMEKKGEKASVSMLTEAELKLRSVFSELPSYEVIIPAMMEHGIMKLGDVCKLQPGVPLKPMLAKPTKAISEVLDRFENKRFTCEYKYDGERAQIHFVSSDSLITYPATSISAVTSPTKGITKIFSRNSEDLSKKYPDILAALDKWVKPGVESFVLDCEAVAWDKDEKRVLPFQQLMTRKRKDVKIEDVKVKVCVFAFDMLFLNGKSLCQETLEERRRLMHKSFTEIEGEFAFATYADANDLEQIQIFLDKSVKASCEGLMVKMLDGEESGYEPSKRSRNWLKIKKDYLAGIGDSLDLVVLGAYHGRGKRTGGYGAFLLACYNPSTQNYETICNIGTGFSEANLEEFHTLLSELEIDKPKPYFSHDNGNKQQPDVWFEPKMVWEVKAADLSLSPVYKAAAGMADDTGKGRGISLRFPRFIKVRDDKGVDDATTCGQVADMYKRQEVVTNGGKKGKGVDDDFEY